MIYWIQSKPAMRQRLHSVNIRMDSMQNHQIHIGHLPIYWCPIHIIIMNNIITSMCLWNQLKRLSQCFRSHSLALADASLSKRPNLTLVKFTKTFPVQMHCRRYHLSICMKLDLLFWMAGRLLRTVNKLYYSINKNKFGDIALAHSV